MIFPSNYRVLVTTINTTIGQIYAQMDPIETHKQWSSEVPMTSGSVWTTAWMGRMPKARPWFGSRVIHEPALQSYSVEPLPYELTYGNDRFVLDDAAGWDLFMRTLPDMATQWRRQPEYEIRDLLEAAGIFGTTSRQIGMDGLSAFNTAHPIDIYNPAVVPSNALFSSGTYCNDFTSGGQTIDGTLIGGGLSQTSLATMLAYMQLIPDESGETLGVIPTALMVPSTLETTAKYLIAAEFLASPVWGAFSQLTGQVGSADNMLRKEGLQVIVNKFLRATKTWYLLDNSHAYKPLLWITREAPRTTPRVNENDPLVWDSHRYAWGGWDRVTPAWNYSWLYARSGP
jgi:phage major head subunit gpT-like protein